MAYKESAILEFKGDARSALEALKQVGGAMRGLLKDIQRLSSATGLDKVAGAFRQLGSVAKDVGHFAMGMFGGIGGRIGDLLNPLKLVQGAFRALGDIAKTALGVTIGNAITALSRTFRDLAGEIVTVAARAQDIGRAFQVLTSRHGVMAKQLIGDMSRIAKGTIDSTRLQEFANRALLAGGQLLAKELPKLMQIARAAAIATGKSFEYVFSTLLTGVIKGSPLLIDNAEIYVRLGQAVERYAEAQGKTVEQLTSTERMMATLNAVLAQGAEYATLLGESFESALDPMQRLSAGWANLKTQVGTHALPVFNAAMDILHEIVGGMGSFIEEHRPVFEGFGLALAEGLRSGWEQVKAFLAEIAGELVPDADPAEWFRSGLEIVVSLADGLLRGLTDYVIPALVAIAQTIADFLLAASPPKKGPLQNLVKGAVALINEYLKGFTKADFSILNQVGRMIYDALKSAVALGDLAESQLVPVYKSVRTLVAELIATFRETGEISEEVLGRIAELLGEGGEEYVKYLRLQLEYQQALRNLVALQEEYAKAEAKGFVSQELKDKLAAAEEAVETAEEELSWQEQYLKAQQESVDLQAQQLRIMDKMAKAVGDVASKMGKVATAMESVKPPDVAAEDFIPDLSGKIGEMTGAISTAALEWKDKFLQAFEPLGRLKEPLEGLSEFVKGFIGVFSPEQRAYLEEFGGGVSEAYEQGELARQAFDNLVKGIKLLPGAVGDFVTKLKDIQLWFEGLPPWVQDILKGTAIFATLNFATAGGIGAILKSLIVGAFTAAGLAVTLEAGALLAALYITIKPFLSPEVREDWKQALHDLFTLEADPLASLGKAAETTLEHTPLMNKLLEWADKSGSNWTEAIIGSFQRAQPGLHLATEQAIRDPILQAGEDARMGLVGQSIIPEMVTSVVRWLTQMKTQAVSLLTQLKTQAIQLFTQIKTQTIQLVAQMVKRILESLVELRDGSEEILSETAEIFEKMAERIEGAILEIRTEIEKLLKMLDDLISKAQEAKEAMEDAGILPSSPPGLEIGLRAINAQLKEMRAGMGGLTGDLNTTLAAAVPANIGAGGGDTYYLQFSEGALSFPNIKDGRDAQDLMRALLDDLASQAAARAAAGFV